MKLFSLKNESEHPIFTGADLRKLIWPLLLEQVLVMLVGMADTVMVSTVGEEAVSGVSLIDMINMLIFSILSALATGGAVVTAQYIGKRMKEKACETANQLMYTVLAISVTVMLLSIAVRRPMLSLFFGSIEEDVMSAALLYFLVSTLSYPFIAMYNAGAALFRSMGKSKVTLWVSFLMNIVNVTFNAIFIFGMKQGVLGAALGSLIARVFAAVFINVLLLSPKHEIHYILGRPSINLDDIRRILYIGIPSGLENGIFQLGRVVVVSIIATFGTAQIAANAVANNFDFLGVIPGNAMQLAMITVVGRCVGAGEHRQAEYYAKKLMFITWCAFLCWNGVILSTLPWTIHIYNISDEAMALAKTLVTIHNGCAIIIWPTSFVLPNALRASNDVRFPMVISIFSMIMFRVMFSFIFGQFMGFGAIGVWMAMVLDWLFRSIFFVARFQSGKWKQKRLI